MVNDGGKILEQTRHDKIPHKGERIRLDRRRATFFPQKKKQMHPSTTTTPIPFIFDG